MVKDSTKRKIDECRRLLVVRYPGYWGFDRCERIALAASILVDDFGVHEVGGNNRGDWVEAFLDSAGESAGGSWCAASVVFVSIVANSSGGYRFPFDRVKVPSRVSSWADWGRNSGRLRSAPVRGGLAFRVRAHGGHCGVSVRPAFVGVLAKTIEGNTSGGGGSQEDGDVMARKTRVRWYWDGYIDLS